MRKILFGCTIFFLVALVAGGVLFYKGCVVPIRNVTADVMQMTKLGNYNAGLANKSTYTPPADAILRTRSAPGRAGRGARCRRACSHGCERSSLPGRMKTAGASLRFTEMMSTFKASGPIS
jgi:hypothetical protein